MAPEDMHGELKAQLMQVLLLAAAHPERPWEMLAGQLLAQLAAQPRSGGIDYLYVFLRYLLHTQERTAQETLRTIWRQHAPQIGEQLMTYAQELLQEGEMKAKVQIIEHMLQKEMTWTAIEEMTGISEAQFQEFKQRLAALEA